MVARAQWQAYRLNGLKQRTLVRSTSATAQSMGSIRFQ
jgi:hypothetical protein